LGLTLGGEKRKKGDTGGERRGRRCNLSVARGTRVSGEERLRDV